MDGLRWSPAGRRRHRRRICRLFAQHGALVEVAEIDQQRADRIRDEVTVRADASAATSSTSPSTMT
jgi:hypothetical protein